MTYPSEADFLTAARSGRLIPVYRDLLADLDTPVAAYMRLGCAPHSFLLESVTGGEQISRYSFIGVDPFLVMKSWGRRVTLEEKGEVTERELPEGEDPLHLLASIMARHRMEADPELPPFCGGAVGYIGYDTVRFFERLPDAPPDDRGLPDCYFVFNDLLVIFDHVSHRMRLLCLARGDEEGRTAYRRACERLDELEQRLRTAPLPPPPARRAGAELQVNAVPSSEQYERSVEKAREYIAAGDIIQVVLSRRMQARISSAPLDIYRALRSVNPSPYMFLLQFEECQLIGASPEILVTERRGEVVTRPIAGTTRRGRTRDEDLELERKLLADPKERAEHVMLVDLHRNDIGRVCEYGSVAVDELMVTERYSHVIHIVSNVIGRLRPGCDAYDLIRATFPAGTLSGAPKIRAMQIIDELETVRRGPYGGCIGYFSFNGNMDTAITLRTIVMQGDTAYVQAGGGIVADSNPDAEFRETESKAGALLRALEMAERGLELD